MAAQLLNIARSLQKLSLAGTYSPKVLCVNPENKLGVVEVIFGNSTRNTTNFFNRRRFLLLQHNFRYSRTF